jgi:2-amino-4-hydroxy-6-hydroxymethyldihydropteridine diphosphokinase
VRAFIGLGSNLGDGPGLIAAALAALQRQPHVRVLRVSSLYRTAAWGATGQPDFTNAVAELATTLEPESLLSVLLEAESSLGRERSALRWGPRTIDIDLLCCGQCRVHTAALQLPHPRMHLRAFVLVPLLELEPEWVIAGIGPARECLEALEFQAISRMP